MGRQMEKNATYRSKDTEFWFGIRRARPGKSLGFIRLIIKRVSADGERILSVPMDESNPGRPDCLQTLPEDFMLPAGGDT